MSHLSDLEVHETSIVITGNSIDLSGAPNGTAISVGTETAFLNLPDPSALSGISILIKDERLDWRARLSFTRFINLTEGKTGLIRLGPCPECGKMGVYEDGKVVHDADFDLVEEVMES
jgi:hypothetical protein